MTLILHHLRRYGEISIFLFRIIAWEWACHGGHEIALDPNEELVLTAILWAEALAGVRLTAQPCRPQNGLPDQKLCDA